MSVAGWLACTVFQTCCLELIINSTWIYKVVYCFLSKLSRSFYTYSYGFQLFHVHLCVQEHPCPGKPPDIVNGCRKTPAPEIVAD